ncbi:MAG: hypothetical protein QOI27_2850 [Gaiellaceae bacterium]|jgi:hypothetical protein|nr:hypothetical protein [Gaiellaceae bacterium]
MRRSQRVLLASMLAIAVAVGLSAPGRAQAAPSQAPGPWCGGALWKLMTLSDSGRSSVKWTPAATSIPDIAALAAPAKAPSTRATPFQKQVWQVTATIDQFRVQSNGEIALVLFDTANSKYMNAYLPNPNCLAKTARGRGEMLAARSALGRCPKPTLAWQPLGITVQVRGVGFWNPVHTTKGALPTGAELRPVTGLTVVSGCGI